MQTLLGPNAPLGVDAADEVIADPYVTYCEVSVLNCNECGRFDDLLYEDPFDVRDHEQALMFCLRCWSAKFADQVRAQLNAHWANPPYAHDDAAADDHKLMASYEIYDGFHHTFFCVECNSQPDALYEDPFDVRDHEQLTGFCMRCWSVKFADQVRAQLNART